MSFTCNADATLESKVNKINKETGVMEEVVSKSEGNVTELALINFMNKV